MPLFKVIDLFLDETARAGPEQMALDEALLEHAKRPLLRVYHWAGRAVSFGYSQSLGLVGAQFPSTPCVRRWTGGGVVEHGSDWTFSLVVPFAEPLAATRPQESYRLIHDRIATALNELGYPARLVKSGENTRGVACFSSPVLHDVIDRQKQKLCGGAQRRTRHGLLHQGSIQNILVPHDFGIRLLLPMAAGARRFFPDRATVSRTEELLAQKYATSAWLGKVL